MKKFALLVLLVLLCGCVNINQDVCESGTDCTSREHVMCDGGWQCVQGKCDFVCTIPPTDTTVTTLTTVTETTQTTQTTLIQEKLVLDSFSQSPCPENYLDNRYKNDVSVMRAMAGWSKEYLFITHSLDYVCCANITVSMNTTTEGSYTVINLYEKNIGKVCRCICGYNITSVISGLTNGKDYLIRIYGVEYNGEGSELIKEVSTNPIIRGEGGFCGGIAGLRCMDGLECKLEGSYPDAGGVCVKSKSECSSDKDCAVGGCSGQVCTTKEKATGLVTTCEFRSGYECFKFTSCGCVDGNCSWRRTPTFDSCIKNLVNPI